MHFNLNNSLRGSGSTLDWLLLGGTGIKDTVKTISWWRHQIETFSALMVLCWGNSPVSGDFPHKGQWRGAFVFSLICAWTNGWSNNRHAGDLRRHQVHYDVTLMCENDFADDVLHFTRFGKDIWETYWILRMRCVLHYWLYMFWKFHNSFFPHLRMRCYAIAMIE